MPGPKSSVQAAVLAQRQRQAPFIPELPQTLEGLRALLRPAPRSWASEPPELGLAPDDSGAWARTKGMGYLGGVPMPDGGAMTEYSMADDLDGQRTEFPTVTPTLTPAELAQLILAAQGGRTLPSAITGKAKAFARLRRQQGKSPFAQPGDLRLGAPTLR